MSDRNDALSVAMRALLAYREELDGMQPSVRLDERMEDAVRAWSTDQRRARPKRLLYWAAAAAAATIIVTLCLRLLSEGPGHTSGDIAGARVPPESRMMAPLLAAESEEPRASAAASSAPEVAVFRVRASLGAAAAAAAHHGPAAGKYWVDVGVGNDGALRIVRVLPADGPQTVVP